MSRLLTDQKLNRVLDDIMRQVVCDCGNYRHHGVDWMPEGSGEGKSVGREILRAFIREIDVQSITGTSGSNGFAAENTITSAAGYYTNNPQGIV